MNCWMCNYFYTKAKDKPCSICKDKNLFKLWEGKNEKTIYISSNERKD